MNDKNLLSLCNDRLRQARAARQPYEADMFLNLSFYQGDQWVAWDGQSLYRPNMKRGRITLTDNRIKPIVRTEVAKMTKARPGWTATPRAADDQAVNDATTAERLLEWGYDHLSFARVRREALTWARVVGAGFVKTTWDPTVGGGQEVLVNPAGEAIRHPDTGRVVRKGDFPEIEAIEGVGTQAIGEGEVRLDVRSPFDIYPDPLATSLDDARWIIDEVVRSPEYVQERYGVKLQPDAPAQTGIVESRFRASVPAGGELAGIRVFELWERPSKTTPGGRYVVWAAGAILAQGDNPYEDIPYEMFPGIHIPGRFWPDAVVSDLRPVQARRNKLLSQVAENAARFGNPSLLTDKLANVKYYGVPGEQIEFSGNTPTALPQFLQPPQMPGYVLNLMQEMDASMREISGQYEVSQGTVPSGVTAASAISLLQEQDATRLGPDVEAMENALSRIGQRVLQLMAKHYTTERVVVIAGEDGVIDIDSFRANNTFQVPDVQVQAGSTFPRSLAAKQAAIRDMLNLLFQYGLPIGADALARVLRDMQVGGLERLVGGFVADQQAVAREHVDLLRGSQLKVQPQVDNHDIHIAVHRDFAKTARFRSLAPEAQQELLRHLAEHEQLQSAAAASAALQAPVPPAPGGAGALPPGPAPPADALPTYPSGDPLAQDPGGFVPPPTV